MSWQQPLVQFSHCTETQTPEILISLRSPNYSPPPLCKYKNKYKYSVYSAIREPFEYYLADFIRKGDTPSSP